MASMLWHPIPGRLQSVSVTDKSDIWGVTLDLQLCKFNTLKQQWQLVSVTESVNRSRFSAASTQSAQSALTNDSSMRTTLTRSSTAASTASTATALAAKTISSILPALGLSNGSQQQQGDGPCRTLQRENSVPLSDPDSESDTTIQVSAASDGTVVRLDRMMRAWFLITPHDQADFEKDAIWVDLGQVWKCVSIASVSQIWGLTESGDIYFGTSNRFAQLESSITSGAGYNKPTFTHISVGHDNVVLATDCHTGTVFRLKTHPMASHPPVWTALSGTGPGSLHFMNCTLSNADYIVGVAVNGQAYRLCNSKWTPLGGGAKLDSVGVGVDGYVLGVDLDGDLFGCQLQLQLQRQNTVAIPRRMSSRDYQQDRSKEDYFSSQISPPAPNFLSNPTAPRVQAISKRPLASPRELFEMAAVEKGPSPNNSRNLLTPVESAGESGGSSPMARSPLGTPSLHHSRNNSYSARHKYIRSESQRSYASEVYGSSLALSGLNTTQKQREELPTISGMSRSATIGPRIQTQEDTLPSRSGMVQSSTFPLSVRSPGVKTTPLRIQTGRELSNTVSTDKEEYNTWASPIRTSNDTSPPSGFPIGGDLYSSTSHASSQVAVSTTSSPNDYQLLSARTSSSSSASKTSDERWHRRGEGQAVNGGDKQEVENDGQHMSLGNTPLGATSKGVAVSNVDSTSGWDINGRGVLDSARAGMTHEAQQLHRESSDSAIPKKITSTEEDGRSGTKAMAVDPSKGYNPLLDGKAEWDENGNGQADHTNVDMAAARVPFHESRSYEILNEGARESGWEKGGGGGDRHGSDQDKKDWILAHSNNYPPSLPSPPNPRTSYSSRDSVDSSYHPWQAQQPSLQQPSHQDRYQLTAGSQFTAIKSVPGDKQEFQGNEHESDLSEGFLLPPGLRSHRPSNASDVLMLQQQEFLRLTRLRSEPSSLVSDKDSKNDGDNNISSNKGFSSDDQHSRYTRPINNIPTPILAPVAHSPYGNSSTYNNSPLAYPPSNVGPCDLEMGNQLRKRAPRFVTVDDDTPDRPSYSSSHLQHYLNTTLPTQNARESRQRSPGIAMSPLNSTFIVPSAGSSVGGGGGGGVADVTDVVAPYAVANAHTNTVDGVGRTTPESVGRTMANAGLRKSASTQGRIVGEDDQGRWIAGTAENDRRVTQFDPEVHKSKCCLIL
ncbi:hypothetical protein EDD21DRAFT_381963 [Dissophora ornata]|nr:hypothetical protein EDD21DRAFT_381963 [Dissophora ornata]